MDEKVPDKGQGPISLAAREENFLDLLETLPVELGSHWRTAYEDLPEVTVDFFTEFERFYKLRTDSLSGRIETIGELSPDLQEEIKLVEWILNETYGNDELFLGSGRTAKVYVFPVAPNTCVKYIYYESPVDISVEAEVSILNILRGFSAHGVRTPTAYFKQVRSKERHYYGMEKIPGDNLFNVIHKPKENKALIKIAQTLNPAEVIKQLLGFIDEIYVRFGVTHGDLRQSNIMIDDQGNFYVIDFGKGAVEDVGEDHEERVRADKLTVRHEVNEFFKSIDKIIIE